MILPMRYSAFQKESQKTLLANVTPTGARQLAMGETSMSGRHHHSRGALSSLMVMKTGDTD